MNLRRTTFAAALAAAILLPSLACAAGYGIYEQGARALGMAGANAASVNDASADFYNPAAMVRLEGKQLSFGGTWLTTRTSFAGAGPYPGYGVTEEMNNGNFFPPNFYFTDRVTKTMAFGLGVNAPFGLGVDWKNPDTFTDRAYVTKADLKSINVNLGLSWAFDDQLSFGAGFDALYAGVELRRISPSGAVIPETTIPLQVRAHLKGGYTPGYGYNVGALWTPDPSMKLAVTYRSKVEATIKDGTADFAIEPTGNSQVDAIAAAGLPPSQGVSTTLKFPAIFSSGLAWSPSAAWTYEADLMLTQWSEFDALALNFAKTPALNSTVQEDYGDSFRLNLGAEHKLAKYTYRFGYYYDQEAAPVQSVTTLLPDASRQGVTVGLGFKLGKTATVDLYNLALLVKQRSTDSQNSHGFNGTYKSYVNASGVSLAYHW